jgi:hypothetical protein
MSKRARFLLFIGLALLSCLAIPFGVALTWVAGRFFASVLGWA